MQFTFSVRPAFCFFAFSLCAYSCKKKKNEKIATTCHFQEFSCCFGPFSIFIVCFPSTFAFCLFFFPVSTNLTLFSICWEHFGYMRNCIIYLRANRRCRFFLTQCVLRYRILKMSFARFLFIFCLINKLLKCTYG